MSGEDMTSESVFVTGCGHQDCKDMHSWGPGVRQNYIIHYILRGTGCLVTDGKTYMVKQGESFLTYPGKIIHYFPDAANPWEYVWIDFIGEDIPSLLKHTEFTITHPVCSMSKEKQERLLDYFLRVRSIDIYYENKQEAAGVLRTILGCYADASLGQNAAIPEKRDGRLANALMLIQSNYHKSEFHIGSLCRMMMMNRVALYRQFQSSLFCSPNEYLLNYRVEQAKKLLLQGFSVKQTSLSCGFTDPYYFSKAFKQRVGAAPTEWRTNLQGKDKEKSE